MRPLQGRIKIGGMRGRSHRHRVPTARPPSDALGIVYIWGRGQIGSALHAYLRQAGEEIVRHDDIARALAISHGCPIDVVPDTWAWRIDGVNLRQIDDLTQDDRAVMGWTQYQRETCAPSLALQNALNAITPDEMAKAAPELEERFAKPGHAHVAGDPNQWIARDDRVVFFDAAREEWRLGDYTGT